MNYKKDIEIDKYALDGEWEKQAALFAYWAEKVADASFERDREKERLGVLYADLDTQVRNTAKSKPTETAIKSAIIIDPIYKSQMKKYHEAGREVKIYETAREALRHKKDALAKLTDLWIAGYYADTKPTGVHKRITDKKIKRLHKRKND